MVRKLALLLFIGFYVNSYSQVGEYVSEEYFRSYDNKYYVTSSYLNLKKDKTFDLVIVLASDTQAEKEELCSKIKGTWVMRDIFLYLEDKDNKQVYYFIFSKNKLIDPNFYILLENNDPERKYFIKEKDYTSVNEYLEKLGYGNRFSKINKKSDLDNFKQLKKQICK